MATSIDTIDADLLDALGVNAKGGIDAYSIEGRSVTVTGIEKQLAALERLRAMKAGGASFAAAQNVAEVG